MLSPWQPEWYKVTLTPKMDISAGKCKLSYICLQPTRIVKCCMHFYIYCLNDYIGTILLFCLRNLSGQKPFFAKYGPKTGETASRPEGRQHVFPNYLWPWDNHWYFFNSIQVKFYIEANMYHIQLHNENWNPKAYVPKHHVHQVDEKRVVTAVHIKRQNIHGMVYNR